MTLSACFEFDMIFQVIYKADMDGDGLLDKKELALWLHKNERVNKAAEVKGEFWVSILPV